MSSAATFAEGTMEHDLDLALFGGKLEPSKTDGDQRDEIASPATNYDLAEEKLNEGGVERDGGLAATSGMGMAQDSGTGATETLSGTSTPLSTASTHGVAPNHVHATAVLNAWLEKLTTSDAVQVGVLLSQRR